MLSRAFLCLLAFCQALVFAAEVVPRATFSEVTNYGSNPTNTRMFLFVPQNLAAKPAIVVGLHWCSGSAQAYYSGSNWARLSETYGYIVIYPSTPYLNSNCWDVASKKALTRGGGGNSDSIANMVKFVLQQYNADASRVYVTGISSGAMMTNVMAATYPDLFAAGIAYAGVPAGCFHSAANIEAEWNNTCATGQSITTPEHWASIARAMAPGYTGRRPKMQLYHGDQDNVLYPQNYHESVKQWASLFGYSTTPRQTLPSTPRSPYTKYVFGPNLEGFLGTGVGHGIDVFFDEDLKWFGFTTPVTPVTTTTRTTAAPTSTVVSSTRTTSAGSSTTTTPSSQQQTRWGQCGGIGYTGPTVCQSPWTCVKSNDWYSQCL